MRLLPAGWRAVPMPLFELSMVLVLVLLSWQLFVIKRANARMRGEIERSTRAFVIGDSIPALQLRMSDGRRTMARQFCDGGRQLVLVVSSPICRDCTRLRSQWGSLVGRPDLAVLLVETGPNAGAPVRTRGLLQATADPSAVVASLRIREVPAVLLGGTDCRIRAAGAGLTASRSVLALVGEPVLAAATSDSATPSSSR